VRRIRAQGTRDSKVLLPCDRVLFSSLWDLAIVNERNGVNWKWRKFKLNWLDCPFVGLLSRFSLSRSFVHVYWFLRCTSPLSTWWSLARLLSLWCISLMKMNKIWSGDGFTILCECHGLADDCDSEEWCSHVIMQNYDVGDSWWHHHLDGNGKSGHFQVLIENLVAGW
jgi:hypothetical protein